MILLVELDDHGNLPLLNGKLDSRRILATSDETWEATPGAALNYTREIMRREASARPERKIGIIKAETHYRILERNFTPAPVQGCGE